MKRNYLLCTALFLLLLLGLGTVTAEAASSGSCGENVTWTLDDEGVLTISGTGPMKNYYWYGNDELPSAPRAWHQPEVTELHIENGVTSIGDFAFDRCSNLTSVTVPDSVKRIGDYAFASCDGLREVHISNLATWCGISFSSNPLCYAHNLYLGEEMLKDLIIPDSVTSIGAHAFSGFSSLRSVTLPDSLKSIGASAFESCTGLTKVNFTKSSEPLEICSSANAFKNTALTDIGDGLTFYYNEVEHGYQYKTEERPLDIPRLQANEGDLYICVPGSGNAAPVAGLQLDPASMSLNVGETAALTLVLPEGASEQAVTWTTSAPDVAAVKDGTVTAIGAGTAVITAQVGNQSAACSVSVTSADSREQYSIGPLVIRDSAGAPLTAIPDGSFLITVPVTRLAGGDALVLLAAYTAEGQYRGLMYVSLENATEGATVSVTLPVENPSGDIAALKAFAVSSFGDMTPLGSASVFPAPTE